MLLLVRTGTRNRISTWDHPRESQSSSDPTRSQGPEIGGEPANFLALGFLVVSQYYILKKKSGDVVF